MNRIPYTVYRIPIILLLALFMYGVATAQSPVSATLDRDVVTTDDRVTLTVTVVGANASRPVLPTMDGLSIVSQGLSSQTSIVNGVVNSQAAYTFILQPTQAGMLTIDQISVLIDGVAYQTEPLTLQVEEGIAPLPSDNTPDIVPPTELNGQDFYVEALVDNENPYVGEQILYLFRFYQAAELLGRPAYDPPEFVGFWLQQETQQTSTIGEFAGRTYRVTELQTPLFPTLSGEREIDSAEFSLPNSTILLTNPVTVDVQSLPQPAPDNFSGATGIYQLSASIDADQVVVNDPVTLRVVVQGIGNIDTLPEPEWPEIEGWRMFESGSSVNTRFENGIVSGNRVYERTLIPIKGGNYELPPIEYVYFDPTTEQYEVAQSEPFSIVVVGGDLAEAAEANEAEEVVLRPLKQAESLTVDRPIYTRTTFWLLWLIPLVVFAGDALWLRQRGRVSTVIKRRRSDALRVAKQMIKQVNQQPDAAEQILTDYLSKKLARPIAGLTAKKRAELLQAKQIEPELIDQTNSLYQRVEQVRFGGNGVQDSAELFTTLSALLDQLDSALAH